jgi:hypothetical protein
MTMLSAAVFMQTAGAAQSTADSTGAMSAGIGLGTGGEMTLVAILALALVGAVAAMVAGDVVRRREAARRPAEWGDGR